MTSRADLFNMAKKHGFTRANVMHWQMWCEEDDLIALINEVLELAALECEDQSSEKHGIYCYEYARAIRALKPSNDA